MKIDPTTTNHLARKQTLDYLASLETHKIQNVERRLRLEGRIIRKFLTLAIHEDVILNSMTQTRKKWNSLVLSRDDI